MTDLKALTFAARFFFAVLFLHCLFFLEWNLGPPPTIFRESIGLFSWIPYPNFSLAEHFSVFLVFLVFLSAAFIRPQSPTFIFIVLSFALYYFSFAQIMGNPRHQYQPVVLFLAGFLLLSLDQPQLRAKPWIVSLRILWCLPYFAAGLSKLRNSGFDFVTQTDFPRLVEITRLWFFDSSVSPPWKAALDQAPLVYSGLAASLLLAQLTCPLVLVFKRLQLPYVVYFAGFHLLSFQLLGFDFLPWLATFGIWLPFRDSASKSTDLNPLSIGATRHP